MKKVINGKMYDTDTATEVCCRKTYEKNVCHSTEYLMQKKNGEFFIYHEDNSHEYSDYIQPVSSKRGLRFAETNMTGDEYVNYFGEVEE